MTSKSLQIQRASLASPIQADAIRFLSDARTNVSKILEVLRSAHASGDASGGETSVGERIAELIQSADSELLNRRLFLKLLDRSKSLAAEANQLSDNFGTASEIPYLDQSEFDNVAVPLQQLLDDMDSLEERIAEFVPSDSA